MGYQNPHSSSGYTDAERDSAMGFSTPWQSGRGFKDNPVGWLTGTVAFNDMNRANAPVYNTFQADAYQGDPGSYQLGDQYSQQYNAMGQAVQNRQGPQAQFRGDQAALVQALQARAAGDTPSAAEMQMRKGMGDAVAAQRSQAASATGANRALAGRTAARNVGDIQQGIAGQTAQLRAQEQAQAEQTLGGVLSGARGQDIQMQATNDQMTQFYMNQGLSRDQAQLAAAMEMERQQASNYNQAQALNAQIASENVQQERNSQSGALSAAGQLIGGIFSDERLKEDVQSEDESLDDFVRKLKPVSYDYVEREDLPRGRQYGIMAQDLEKSDIGKTLVIDTPKGKMVDTARGYGAVLASLRRLDDRLSKVEGS